jgi:DNA-binding transcriptional ArsR family regulator
VYLREPKQLEASIENLAGYRGGLSKEKNGIYLSGLPDNLVISKIVDPLSHESRFAMLRALSTGSMTFKDLGELTGSKGGHLLYHIGKLVDAGLVVKTDAGKRYSITDRGLGVMDLVRKMYVQAGN